MYVLLSTIKRSDLRSGERGVVTVLHRGLLSVRAAALVASGLAGCDGVSAVDPAPAAAPAASARFAEEIHQPSLVLGLRTGDLDQQGRAARVPCRVCHDRIEPREELALAKRLERFHAGVVIEHGDNTCRTCHNPPRFQDFRLASGRSVEIGQVIELCAQCHGGIYRDYQHGAHGGMSGHWDLTRGPRDRNHCLDCHDAHRPAITRVLPAPYPKYRFLESTQVIHD